MAINSGKNSGKKGKQAGPQKSPPKKVSKTSTKRSGRASSGEKNPIYVLVILGLITVIILMVNKLYLNKSITPVDKKGDVITAEDIAGRDRESKTTDNEEIIKDKDKDKAREADKETATNGEDSATYSNAKIYLIRINDETEKMYLSSVKRKISTHSPLENTMRELIRGPSSYEKKKGYLTAIPKGLRLNSLTVKNRTAILDFNTAIEEGAVGNILISRIDQIVYTATQFEKIDNVIITINGRRRSTLGSDGLSISGPLQRR